MKKILIFLMILILSFSLIACDKQKDTKETINTINNTSYITEKHLSSQEYKDLLKRINSTNNWKLIDTSITYEKDINAFTHTITYSIDKR